MSLSLGSRSSRSVWIFVRSRMSTRQITFNPLPSSLDFIRAGKLRGLAVTGATRSGALPNLPTLGEFLPGYEATAWFGIGAPKATPSAVVEKLNKEINAALADAQFRNRLVDLGGAPMPLSTTDFSNFIGSEIEKWAKVVKFSGAKAE
jgi:tripartite-type tricarboxylate transporter receptor subunit TctC